MADTDAESKEQAGLNMEYTALRYEVVSRVQLRTQIALATLTLAGVTLTIGLNTPVAALLFPVLSMFLAAAWIQNDARVKEITTYIRERIEGRLAGLGWETYRHTRVHKATRIGGARLSVLSAGGVFVVTQLMAIFIALSKASTFTALEWVATVIAAAVTLLTVALFRLERRPVTA